MIFMIVGQEKLQRNLGPERPIEATTIIEKPRIPA
jgi:hypothetical protein